MLRSRFGLLFNPWVLYHAEQVVESVVAILYAVSAATDYVLSARVVEDASKLASACGIARINHALLVLTHTIQISDSI